MVYTILVRLLAWPGNFYPLGKLVPQAKYLDSKLNTPR